MSESAAHCESAADDLFRQAVQVRINRCSQFRARPWLSVSVRVTTVADDRQILACSPRWDRPLSHFALRFSNTDGHGQPRTSRSQIFSVKRSRSGSIAAPNFVPVRGCPCPSVLPPSPMIAQFWPVSLDGIAHSAVLSCVSATRTDTDNHGRPDRRFFPSSGPGQDQSLPPISCPSVVVRCARRSWRVPAGESPARVRP